LIDYTDGQYSIRARQYDDTTGLASPGPMGLYGRGKARPVIRQGRTRDRAFVAAVAAGLVEQDLGLLGTVVSKPDKDGQVSVRLQGGALGGPLDRLVRPGYVFAVAAARAPSRPGEALPWALLRVEKAPRDGVCQCRYFTRHGDPLLPGNLCILLGTVTTPLRIHLSVGDATSLTLEIRRRSFQDVDFTTLQSRSREERLLRTPADVPPFAHVAFVTVRNRKDLPIIPVALIDSEPVEIALSAEVDRDPLRFSRENWEQNVRATFLKVDPLLGQLNKLTREDKDRSEILRLAQSGLQDLRADLARLSAQRKDLLDEAEKLPAESRPSLAAGEDLLRQVRDVEKQLDQWVDKLIALEKEEPKRRDWLKRLGQAQVLETQAEIGQALEIYRKILMDDGFDEKGLKERVEKLEALWKPVSEKHRQARQFIYHTWPKLTTPRQLLDHIKQATDALNTCIEAKDRFGSQRFLTFTLAHGASLARMYAKLNPDLNLGDREPAREIKEVTEKLDALARKAQEYLRPGAADQCSNRQALTAWRTKPYRVSPGI
jgi:hypothetical protein